MIPEPTPTSERRNVALLFMAQALFQTGSVLAVTLAALVGALLAPDRSLATLSVTATIIATAVAMIPAALFMQRRGRKAGFLLGAGLGVLGGLLSAAALQFSSFALFIAGSLCAGGYQAFAQYYRFAAADVARPEFKSRAISWVIAGGIVAAIAGPNLARLTRDVGAVPFLASYLVFLALAIAALFVISRLTLAPAQGDEPLADPRPARPLRAIVRQPVFLTALIGSAVGSAVMVMVMTATPLAMEMHSHTLDDSATVIQWHVLGMFIPSFFTGGLIRRLGVLRVMAGGVILLAMHVAIALAGTDFIHFLSELILLGVGWNFLFIGGTTLLTEAYRPAERAKTQALHDFCVHGLGSLGSLSAGGILNALGWQAVNLTALPFLALALFAIAALAISRHTHREVAVAVPPAE
jgi:MFS family permease